MPIIFYDHLVYKTEILDSINKTDDPDNVKGKAKQLVDDIIHQGVIEFILERLDPKKHHAFLEALHDRPYDPELIAYLKDHISPEIEQDIQSHIDHLITEIKEDLLIATKK